MLQNQLAVSGTHFPMGKNLLSSAACQEGDTVSKWTVKGAEAKEEPLQIVFPHEALEPRHI